MKSGIRAFIAGAFDVSQLWPNMTSAKDAMNRFIKKMSPKARGEIEALPTAQQKTGGELFANGWLGGYTNGYTDGSNQNEVPSRSTHELHLHLQSDAPCARN